MEKRPPARPRRKHPRVLTAATKERISSGSFGQANRRKTFAVSLTLMFTSRINLLPLHPTALAISYQSYADPTSGVSHSMMIPYNPFCSTHRQKDVTLVFRMDHHGVSHSALLHTVTLLSFCLAVCLLLTVPLTSFLRLEPPVAYNSFISAKWINKKIHFLIHTYHR